MHTLGMWVFLTTLAAVFAAAMIGYFIMLWNLANRTERVDEAGELVKILPMPDLPHLPYLLWVSTLAILLSSVTIQSALSSIRKDDHRGLKRGLLLTLVLAIVFLALQVICWFEWMASAVDVSIDHEAYRFAAIAFLGLSALHAVHVIGGLAPIVWVTVRAAQGAYSECRHIGVHHVALYWHFLDIVWMIMFASLLLLT